jgi:3-hydroxyacyl-[acyl-carrier-protein] dehydratase
MSWPLPLLVESWVQAAAILAAGTGRCGDGVLLLGGLTDVVAGRPVRPGDVVTHRVRLIRAFDLTMIFEGGSEAGADRVLTVGQAILACRPAEQIEPASGNANLTMRNSDV